MKIEKAYVYVCMYVFQVPNYNGFYQIHSYIPDNVWQLSAVPFCSSPHPLAAFAH